MQRPTRKTLAITGVLTIVALGGATLQANAAVLGSSMKKAAPAGTTRPNSASTATSGRSMARSTNQSDTLTKASPTTSRAGTSRPGRSAGTQQAGAQRPQTSSGATAAVGVISYNLKYGAHFRHSEKCPDAQARELQSKFYDAVVSTVQTADLVALQEVDQNVGRSCNHDQAAIIAERLTKVTGKTWKACFARGREVEGGHQGNAVLSSYPGTTCLGELHLGNDPGDGEKRVAARAALTVNGKSVRAYSVHTTSGKNQTSARVKQAKVLLSDMAMHDAGPVIAAGDYNSESDASITTMRDSATDVLPSAGAKGATVESGSQLDHVFTMRTNTTGAQVLTSDTYQVSDHLPIRADLIFWVS